MTRKYLTSLGIEPDIIDKVMDAHGQGLEREKAVADSLRDEVKTLKGEAEIAKKALSDAVAAHESDSESFKVKYEDEVTAHEETKTSMQKSIDDEKAAHKATTDNWATEKDNETVDKMVSELLSKQDDEGIRMNPSAIPKALLLYDRKIVERDKEGKITNSDKIVEHFKGEWGDFFGTVEKQSSSAGGPPDGGDSGKETDSFLVGFDRE